MTSSYTNWDDKSPNNGGVSCAIVTRTGKWHDEPCQSQYSFICKKPSKWKKTYDNMNEKLNKIFSKTFKVLVALKLLKIKFIFLQQQ